MPHVFKLGKGPEQGHVNCSPNFTRTIHMDIGSIYMVVKVPEYELKLLSINPGPQNLILSSNYDVIYDTQENVRIIPI